VIALVEEGRIIEAIKLVRMRKGFGLKEAKDAVEAIRDGRVVSSTPEAPTPRVAPSEIDPAIERLVRGGNIIGAIKLYREQHGVGLKESKDAIDTLRASLGV
jgi:ribosomal protein L7/L12